MGNSCIIETCIQATEKQNNRIAKGKGNKGRCVLIPDVLLELLRTYYLREHPEEYLFNGKSKEKPFSQRAVQWTLQEELPQNAGTAQATLYDMHGRLLQQQIGTTSRLTLDLSALPNGMYMLKVNGDGWLQTARVMMIGK